MNLLEITGGITEASDVATDGGIDLTTIIMAIIGLVGGGAVLKLYESWQKNRKADRQHSGEQNIFVINLLSDQVAELSDKVEVMTNQLITLSVSNAETSAENKLLLEDNNQLKVKNNELIESYNNLLTMNGVLLNKIDDSFDNSDDFMNE
tara:strand:+ start:3969 stop:4418 length:450 start_codon:yes stop_codon:yes gene_type:complete